METLPTANTTAVAMMTQPPPPSSPPLPRLDAYKVDRALMYLQERFDIRRPPHASAALLVLIHELWINSLPWPPRREAAEHIGMSIYGLDGALSVATARGLIALSIETIEGGVARRESVIKQRYYTPSQEVIDLLK